MGEGRNDDLSDDRGAAARAGARHHLDGALADCRAARVHGAAALLPRRHTAEAERRARG